MAKDSTSIRFGMTSRKRDGEEEWNPTRWGDLEVGWEADSD